MDTINLDNRTYYLPASISDVQKLITSARQSKKQIRVCGSGHSVSAAIYPDANKGFGEENIYVMLSKMNGVKIDPTTKTVLVEAGCHLGYDPFDPTNVSTPENSLFAQLDAAGFALPDMGGITHQTVGGFLSTGSAGGSIQYSFLDALESITFIPADEDYPQPITVSKTDPNPDLFYAVGVSMGLLGIIVAAKFSLIDSFNIKGEESITSFDDCPIDMSGQGSNEKTSLQSFLTDTPYTRILWYPQPHVERVVVWKAERMKPTDSFERKPYQEFKPILDSQWIPQFLGDIVYTAVGQWPKWLGDIVGTNNDFYRTLNAFVSQNFYEIIFPQILPLFVVEDKDNIVKDKDGKPQPVGPQEFQDVWYEALPMDNGVSDNVFPVEFTELWIPFDDATNKIADVLKKLNDLYAKYYQNSPRIADGDFCVELYAAKATDFWMSPSYKANVLRVDVFWFKRNLDSPDTNYYPLFWEALAEFGFRCHWGKYLPPASSEQGADYLKQQYPKWDNFMQLRSKYDPDEVFLSEYWKEHLGIEKKPHQIKPKKLPAPVVPDENGYYHPTNADEISELVKHAVTNNLKLRVRGAGQSVNSGIYTDSFQPAEFVHDTLHVNIMLDKMRNIAINKKKKTVTVEAGCHLGCDPYDSCNTSTEDNGLFFQLAQNGLAIPNVPDVLHQTVGGFLSTASSASTMSHSFLDAVLSVSLVDGNGNIKTYKRPIPDNPNDNFYGVVVSMGLMGVIYSVTLQCVDAFRVIGKQTIAKDDAAPLRIFPSADQQDLPFDILPNLKTFLQQTEFARLLWWPYPTARRVVLWQARKMQPGDYNSNTGTPKKFTPNAYEDPFYLSNLPKELQAIGEYITTIVSDLIKMGVFKNNNVDLIKKHIIEVLSEVVISLIFKVIDQWPEILKDLGNEINFLGVKYNTSDLAELAEAAWPDVFPQLMDIFLPLDNGHPQVFWDDWLTALNIDNNEFKNKLLPAYRTELWVPIEKAAEAMNVLNAYYQNQYYPNADTMNKNIANSFFVIEILGAKKDLFWLSPGYHRDSLRITFNSLKETNQDVTDYFQQFWDLFFINEIDFRLHWSYFLPKPNSPEGTLYLAKQYPKWKDFMNLRKAMDPHQIFVNQYWQDQLGIE